MDLAARETHANAESETVLLAMSGGVDSCGAALLLLEQGYNVIGVSMQVWDYRKNGGNAARATCCAPSDFDDAREIADKKGFPYYVFDFEDSFKASVIDPFINSYLEGRTPNPCLDCNRKVKFRELRKRGLALGAKYIATGHYAQVRQHKDGSLGLFTSTDEGKDQSYFLYAMTQEDLKTTLFPVGGMKKEQVRARLQSEGFKVSSKAESQDICFVSDSVSKFIQKARKIENKTGEIVSQDGVSLGLHEGVFNYTVGQRKGLGVSAPNPLYVLEIKPEENLVVVGEKDALQRESFYIKEMHWISGKKSIGPLKARVKLRYRHEGVLCELEPALEKDPSGELGIYKARFLESWSSVSPGQAAVVYAIDSTEDGMCEVLGGGILMRDEDGRN